MAVQQEKARQLIDGMSRFPQTENAVQASENLGGVLDSANHNYQVLLQAVNGQARISSQTVRNLLVGLLKIKQMRLSQKSFQCRICYKSAG